MTDTTTNISDLPTDPTVGGNISMIANEISTSNSNSNTNGLNLDQNTINQIISGLKQSTTTGVTQLSSRDIPMNTDNINLDESIQPNYIPREQNNVDYIGDNERTTDMIDNYNNQFQSNNSLDELYNELQTPILLIVLYFLFQLPVFRKYLFQYFPVLCYKDGNLNIQGLLFTSILFGILFYMLNKITNQFGTF
jgi:hypothetical protein